MANLDSGGPARAIRKWLSSTPRRTFVLYPILIFLLEWFIQDGSLNINSAGLSLLLCGYGLYRFSGSYRTAHGGGGPGVGNPPEKLVDTGIYAYIRNPMYLGHLIYMAGLVVAFSSWAAGALLIFHLWWFHQRVLEDEKHMREIFGGQFDEYAARVRRWGLI